MMQIRFRDVKTNEQVVSSLLWSGSSMNGPVISMNECRMESGTFIRVNIDGKIHFADFIQVEQIGEEVKRSDRKS